MADLGRQSAFMPTVKCSNCGNQVEISLMGDHVCGGGNAPEPAPPMPDLLGGAFSSLKHNVWDKLASKPQAPTVDTSAANQDYNASKRDPPTPLSASTGSRTISPKTPNARSMTGASGDDYFAPAIADSPPPSQSRRPGGYGGFNEPDSQEGQSTYATSPEKQNSSLLTRMNTIAPGPFSGSKNDGAFASPRELTPEPIDDRPGTANSSGSGAMAPPPRMPRKDGYGGFGPPSRDGEEPGRQPYGLGGLSKRSETFPSPSRADFDEAPVRRPSMPQPRSDRLRTPSQRFSRKDTTRVPPPRTSLIRPPTRDSTKTPTINLEDEFGIGNPYHSASDSLSSSNSGYTSGSLPSQSSSNTSPARSTGSRMVPQRKPSDTSNMDSLMKDLSSSMDSLKPTANERPDGRRPPPADLTLAGPRPPQGPSTSQPLPSPMLPPPNYDPAVQGDLRSKPPSGPTHQRMRSRAATATRGNCRACQEPITGKSVSSADGRLSGRYHKACFVCTTCKEPFSSATFYVLGDRPYCEHHYHKLNGSLCGSCNRGIEGQYLEDESALKHHVGCFRCGDCRMVLSNGYFDVNGVAYCERDAFKRMQQQQAMPPPRAAPPPGRRPSAAPAPTRGPGLPKGPGLPSGPARSLSRPFGVPTGSRLAPGQALGRGGLGSMPRMEKRMTRMGVM